MIDAMLVVMLPVLAVVLAVGCSETTSGGSGSGFGGGTSTPSSVGAGGDVPEEELNPQTADWFVERLPGEWDSSAQSEDDPTLTAKHLSACQIDAAELGERVVYLERSDLTTVGQPFEQLVITVEPDSAWYSTAGATFFAPDEPAAWVGLCGRGDRPPPPGTVRELAGCGTQVSYRDSQFFLEMSYGPLPDCDPRPIDGARRARTHLRFHPRVWWKEEILGEDGAAVWDPGGELEYVLERVAP